VRAGDFLTVATGDADAFADASINAFSLAQGELFLARHGSAVSGTFASGVAGIANVTLSAQVVSPPTIAFGPVGTSATNGQISVTISTNLAGLVAVQLGIGAATGTATLSSVTCSAIGPGSGASASVHTSLGDVTLSVAGLPVSLGVTAVPPTAMAFSAPFTWAHSQHVGGTSLGLATAVGGGVAGLGAIVNAAVGPLLAPLENTVMSPILRSLGLSLAGADVAALDPVCLPPILGR
jgi:tight adherence protein G